MSLKASVDDWLRLDKNELSRSEIQSLWDDGNTAELERRMRPRIQFGTSGLRGKMEAGWARMNDTTVMQASQGLCAYVLANVSHAATRGVVIGYDHRHNSERWAKLTAAVFFAQGAKVYLYRGLVHTPMVPFGVVKLKAACGVMITASHNPKQDNGYKVYWENGIQIIGPHDKGITASILSHLEPKNGATEQIPSPELYADVSALHDLYFASLKPLNLCSSLNQRCPLKFVNTSMHGVSHPWVTKAFETFALAPFIPVREQQDPDPDFPTVKFPNPEEKGALDLAMRTAEMEGAAYILAQDPDSDRFASAEKGPDGRWHVFTGDQLGVLFASRTLQIYKSSGKPLDKLAMIASTVSSKMIGAMAQVEGFRFVECLTGFKFIGNTALSLTEQGYDVPFGYEEAIGFMFGSDIRDKDGVAATVSFAEMAVELHHRGSSVSECLRELYQKYGYFQTSNSYFTCTDPPTIDKIFARLRAYPKSNSAFAQSTYPRTIATLPITRVIDLTTGYDSGNPPSFRPELPCSDGQMIQFRARTKGDDELSIVLTIRTSGTEPKIKYYLEGSAKDPEAVSTLLPKVLHELGEAWLEAGRWGLGSP